MSESNGIEWLLLGSLDRRFRPQPVTHPLKVVALKRSLVACGRRVHLLKTENAFYSNCH
jgi:hypothetical protein